MRNERIDEETLLGLQERVKHSITYMGYGREADDCAQEFAVAVLSGKSQHQTVDQFVIDYLRARYGRKGTPGFAKRQSIEFAMSISESQGGISTPGTPKSDLEARIDCISLARLLRGTERVIYRLRYLEGWNAAEIAMYLGVSESRISQRLKMTKMRIDAVVKAREVISYLGISNSIKAAVITQYLEKLK